jgi:hypothetical protein
MRRIAIVTMTAVVLGGLPMVSIAQTGLNQVAKSVRQIDKNFDVADKNRDGKLTLAEAQSGATPFIANHFDAMDTGHKGYVTKADVHAYIKQNLTRNQPPSASSSTGH